MGLRKPGEITRKVNGELVSVTEETAQQLGQDVGIPAVTSPLMGASVGATPDQAKMLGSQANLRSAIRARTTPETLDRAQRTQQYETELDAAAKAQQEKLKLYFENIPGLGKLDEEMARIVQQRLMPDIKAQDQFLGVNWDAVGSFAGNRTDVLNIFAEIGFDRYDENNKLIEPASLLTRALRGEGISEEEFNTLNDTLARISRTMWGEDTAETLTLNDIKEFMNTPDDLIASQILKNKPNEITIGDIDDVTLTRLGLGPDYLNRIFGGENNWKGVTYARVKEQIQELQAAFADIRELERITSDPFASPTLIREANKRLRELGYIGKRSAMEKVNDLQAQIEDGDIVKVGEAIFEIEEILDDDDWMEAINFALQDEKAMERLQENNPELANWIGENRTALIKQYNEMTGYLTGTQNFSDFMVSREEREEIDADIEDFDPQLMAKAREALGIDVTDMDTLTNTQAEALLAQSEKTMGTLESTWNTAIAGVPADFYADRGLNIYSMSEDELTRTAGEIKDEYAGQEFSKSTYSTDLGTLNGILSQLGMTLDEFNNVSGYPPVAGDLTPTQWMWEAGQPTLADQIKKANELLNKKNLGENNSVALHQYEQYGTEFLQWLVGGDAAKLERIKSGEETLNIDTKVGIFNSWVGLAKTDTEKTLMVNTLLSLGNKKDPVSGVPYFQQADTLKTILASPNRTNILKALQSNPESLFQQVSAAKSTQTKYDKASSAKTPKQAWETIFGSGTPGAIALTDLYTKYAGEKLTKKVASGGYWKEKRVGFKKTREWVTTYKDVSIWPSYLDANSDGILDSHTDVVKTLSTSMNNYVTKGSFVDSNGNIGVDLTKTVEDMASRADSLVADAQLIKADKEVQTTWNQDGLGQTVRDMFSNGPKGWGVSRKDVEELLGVSLTPESFSQLTPERQQSIRTSLKEMGDRRNKFNNEIMNDMPLMGTAGAAGYKAMFGDLPNKTNYILKGEGFDATTRKRMRILKNSGGFDAVQLPKRVSSLLVDAIADGRSSHKSLADVKKAYDNRPTEPNLPVFEGGPLEFPTTKSYKWDPYAGEWYVVDPIIGGPDFNFSGLGGVGNPNAGGI